MTLGLTRLEGQLTTNLIGLSRLDRMKEAILVQLQKAKLKELLLRMLEVIPQ